MFHRDHHSWQAVALNRDATIVLVKINVFGRKHSAAD
jgi:hypothetical protein